MTPEQFAYWLQGFFEPEPWNPWKWRIICGHDHGTTYCGAVQ